MGDEHESKRTCEATSYNADRSWAFQQTLAEVWPEHTLLFQKPPTDMVVHVLREILRTPDAAAIGSGMIDTGIVNVSFDGQKLFDDDFGTPHEVHSFDMSSFRGLRITGPTARFTQRRMELHRPCGITDLQVLLKGDVVAEKVLDLQLGVRTADERPRCISGPACDNFHTSDIVLPPDLSLAGISVRTSGTGKFRRIVDMRLLAK